MKEKKRFTLKRFIIIFVIILTVIGVIVSSNIIYNNMQNEEISSYEDKKQKCELLKSIASESITEGIGIDTKIIPSDEIRFRISNEEDSIIFYYYILDDSVSKSQPYYNATITLTSDYKILKEDYSMEIESFDEYIKFHNKVNKFLSILYGILCVCFVGALICLLWIIVHVSFVWIAIYKKKKLKKNGESGGKDTVRLMAKEKYLIHTWSGNEKLLSAKELYERVMEDCKSDYDWIAPARELVRICKKTSFPTEYAIDIKIAILNCFANIEHRANCGGDKYGEDPKDLEAVHYCYNSLYGLDKEEAINARKYYLSEMIKSASYVRSIFDSLFHSGPTYRDLCEQWRNAKFDEYISQKEIDFVEMLKTLRNDFVDTIKSAEENGDFEEDDKKREESDKKLAQSIMHSLFMDDINE